ncbi:MAG TPA: Asp-tRNA(Asn)/Glu-tRNA(Gln) amidotransferase subunit GatC [Methanomicrobiales archaeon]|nr:Asp-tRNA(Asn)/Glu-tRNA(Gln) amidotransferase subunit GatC [Methanomicrobiales archaeon]HVN65868.1 Asp-tRNA(Asn)/Glu-tRNA(Gln) amidotransferase subunit GatC [Methanomicrobiales archaeon]
MISPEDVEKIAHLADIGLPEERLGEFTKEFNAILEYFDVLDTVREEAGAAQGEINVMREDEVTPSLPREEVLALTKEPEDGFIRAPRVME